VEIAILENQGNFLTISSRSGSDRREKPDNLTLICYLLRKDIYITARSVGFLLAFGESEPDLQLNKKKTGKLLESGY